MQKYLEQFFDKQIVKEVLSSVKYKRLYGVINSPVSKLKNVDMDLCTELYINKKLPIYKIAMLYGVSDATMRSYLINHGVKLKGHKVGKNSDNSYFENIDTPDKAYFLGLMVADGNIINHKAKSAKIIQIALTENDKYILDKFNQYANLNVNIIISHPTDAKPRYCLRTQSDKLYSDLLKQGLVDKKSHAGTLMPALDKGLISHFIRGYFDGDGIAKSNGYLGFCGSYTLLYKIREVLVKECAVKENTLTYNKQNGIYYIQWAAKNEVKRIFDYLYKDKQDLYLVRKYEKIKNRFVTGPSYSDV